MSFFKRKPKNQEKKVSLVHFGYGKHCVYSILVDGKTVPESNTMYKEEAERLYSLIVSRIKGEKMNINVLKEEVINVEAQ